MNLPDGKADFIRFITQSLDECKNSYSEQLELCRSQFSEKAVHDFRVSVRRFLAFIMLVGELLPNVYIDRLTKTIKKQLKYFNPLRDTQVQLLVMKDMIYTYPVLYTFYNSLLKKEVMLIENIRIEISDFDIDEITGNNLLFRIYLKERIKNSCIGFHNLFDNSYKAFLDIVGRLKEIDRSDLNTIHKLRLAFKRFRYIAETLQPVTMITKYDIRKMKTIQTVLGEIQDNSVLLNDLDKFIRSQKEIPYDSYRPVITDILSRRELLVDKFLDLSEDISSMWKKKRFRLKEAAGNN